MKYFLITVFVLFLLFIFWFISEAPHIVRPPANEAKGNLYNCVMSMRAIGKALEIYAAKSDGKYPYVLNARQLFPNDSFAGFICPATKRPYCYSVKNEGKSCLLLCKGDNHPGLCPPDYPRYAPETGLVCIRIDKQPEPPKGFALFTEAMKDIFRDLKKTVLREK